MSKASLSAALLLVVSGAAGVSAQTAEQLRAPRQSAYEVPGGARDPMTPIGYQKAPPPGAVSTQAPAGRIETYLVPDAFVVSSISLDRIPLAVINGKAYGEGDSMPFTAGSQKVQLQVFAIRDGTVTLRYREFQVVCPIRSAAQQPHRPTAPTR